jgi:hypothetical protein
MPSTYTFISSVTVGTATSTITLSSIPQTYTDIVLRVSSRQTGTGDVQDSIYVGINGAPSGTLNSVTMLRSNGSVEASNRESSQPQWNMDQGSTAGGNVANTFANDELYIANYRVSQNKVASGFIAHEDNSSTAYLRASAFLWRDTTAISSLVLKLGSGQNFAVGSSFYLYGIKNS